MSRAGQRGEEWRQTRRFVVGLFIAYALLIQALASPFLRTHAAELARLNGPLALLCLSDGAPGHEEPGQRNMPHGHGIECCLPGLRFVSVDGPALAVSQVVFEPPAEGKSREADYALPQSRAPPFALTRVLQPRAPPVSIA